MTPAAAVTTVRVVRGFPWLRVVGVVVLVAWLVYYYFVVPVLVKLDAMTPWHGIIPGSCDAPAEVRPAGFTGLLNDTGRALHGLAEGPPSPEQMVGWFRTAGRQARVGWVAFDAGTRGQSLGIAPNVAPTPVPRNVTGGSLSVAGCEPADDIDAFLAALSGQESGGDYTAVNARTGAAGAFQIMPANWPAWSAEAGLAGAAPTPANQDAVARFKVAQYRAQFGSWEAVAVAWYAGPGAVAGWQSDPTAPRYTRPPALGEPSISEYVRSVIGRMAPSGGDVVEFGKRLQAMGVRVAEHPAFGGVAPVHKGRGHYEGRAIDVNTRPGTSAQEQAELAPIAALARREGFHVLFMVEGHYGHVHIEQRVSGRAA